jgi:hypothetical protein
VFEPTVFAAAASGARTRPGLTGGVPLVAASFEVASTAARALAGPIARMLAASGIG